MRISDILSNPRFRITAVAAAIFTLAYVLINIFVLGGNDFVYSLNNNITIPLAVVTPIFAFSLWNFVKTGRTNRFLWGGLLAGWALWTVAEVLWVVYGYLYQEVPYPSPADFFWLIGYIPMGFGLYARGREIPAKLNLAQKLVLWVISLATIIITIIFILIPILQSNDPSNWLESSLNVVYPLTDLFLLLIITRLIFVYGGGDYKFGWDLLTIGFVLHSISNLIFSYASQQDMYYPDFKVNFISSVAVDMPYNLSYLVWILGLYALRLALGKQKPFERITQLHVVPNTSVLIFLKQDNTVFETSENIHLISDGSHKKGLTLADLLNIPQKEADAFLAEIQAERKIADWPVIIRNRPGVSQEAYITGIATISPNGEYSGCNLVMRVLVENDYTFDDKMTREQKGLVTYVRKISGSSERDRIRKLLLDYHLAYLKRLYNLAYDTGGARLGLAFFEHLRQIDQDRQWKLRFHPENLLENDDYQVSVLREALPSLLDEAKGFVSKLTDPTTVEAEILSVSSQFSEAVHRNVAFYSRS